MKKKFSSVFKKAPFFRDKDEKKTTANNNVGDINEQRLDRGIILGNEQQNSAKNNNSSPAQEQQQYQNNSSRIDEYDDKGKIRRQSVLLPEKPAAPTVMVSSSGATTATSTTDTPTSVTSSGLKESNPSSEGDEYQQQTPPSSSEDDDDDAVGTSSDNDDEDDQLGNLVDAPDNGSRPNMGSRTASHNSRRSHKKLDADDANSIIGGTSISESEHQDPEYTAEQHEAQQQKVFSFSLPFSNPLANFELRSFSSNLTSRTLSFFNNNNNNNNSPTMDSELVVPEDPLKLANINSREEEIIFQNVHDQDNTRLRAVKHAFTPNISIDSLRNPLGPPKPDNFPQVDGDVIIMGGYRGSILRDSQSKRRVWIPIRVGLNIRKIDLTVGLEDEDEYEMEKYIYPDGMLTHIGPVDVSRKLMRKLSSQPNCRLIEFGYDWRLSPDISSDKLTKLIKSLHKQNRNNPNYKGPLIIAHSMGGLIAHHAMQSNPKLIRGIIYAGSPSSCPNILGPLRYGDSVLLSSKVLTAQINFLMRSSFVFLPLNGRCFVDRNDSSKRYDLDFFDVNTWIEYGFSPCVNKSLEIRRTQTNSRPPPIQPPPDEAQERQQPPIAKANDYIGRQPGGSESQSSGTIQTRKRADTFNSPNPELIKYEDAVEYLDRALKRTKKFLHELEYDENKRNDYPPLAVVYGYAVPTLRGARVEGLQGIKDGDYSDLVFGAGDGVVYQKSLLPADIGFDIVAKVPSQRGHVSLLNDTDGVGKALKAILDEEKNRESK